MTSEKPRARDMLTAKKTGEELIQQLAAKVEKDPAQARIFNTTIDDFKPFKGKEFIVKAEDHDNKMTLTQCIALKDKAIIKGLRPPFSLIFELEKGFPFSQQTVSLQADGFEPMDLFMTQITPKEDGSYQYQVIFN